MVLEQVAVMKKHFMKVQQLYLPSPLYSIHHRMLKLLCFHCFILSTCIWTTIGIMPCFTALETFDFFLNFILFRGNTSGSILCLHWQQLLLLLPFISTSLTTSIFSWIFINVINIRPCSCKSCSHTTWRLSTRLEPLVCKLKHWFEVGRFT